MLLVVVLIIWSVVVSSCTVSGKTSSGGSSAEIQTSTIRRERLNSSSLVNVGWYTDNLEWIRDPDKLEKGLAYFYKRAGVSPYAYKEEKGGNGTPSGQESSPDLTSELLENADAQTRFSENEE